MKTHGITAAGRSRKGFTIVEVVVAAFIMAVLMTVAMGAFTSSLRHGREGTSHIEYIEDARIAEQQIVKYVQMGRAISVASDALTIMMPDLSQARVQYVDGDKDATTLDDNVLEYDPNTAVADDEMELCNGVSAIAGEEMFQLVATSPRTALITFHVGEIPEAKPEEELMTAEGYQGVEIRLSATPRNLGTVY